MRELPRGGQLSIHGNTVNVPNDVNSTVHCLPRPIGESQTTPIKLKRRLGYKHHYQFQNVRPKKVLDAAKYLVDTSELFKTEGIKVQNAWVDDITSQSSTHEEWSEFVENPVLMCKVMENAEKIKEVLDNMKYGEDTSFENFLNKLQLTEESYILTIRHTLKRDTLFLKRAPSEIRINSYNTNLLKAWRANMDMQYVLDPYACATYILSCITKGQRGMSRLLQKASEEAKSGNNDITNRVRQIGNKFLNAVEISAQEAVYLVLQMPMRRSSRDFQFISTSPPDERAFLLKKLDKLKELPDNSTDIESDNIIKLYQRRPKQLERFCLADFVALFNCVKDKEGNSSCASNINASFTDIDDFLPETYFEDNTDDDPDSNI